MKKIIAVLVIMVLSVNGFGLSLNKNNNPEMYCLAQNIYFEARGSNFADQLAVADVVLNRVNSKYYPDTICKVVKQGPTRESWKTKQKKNIPDSERIFYPKKNMCQFSWYCDGKEDKMVDKDSWNNAQHIAFNMMVKRDFVGLTEGATHYHAHYVSPKWSNSLHLVGTIGKHKYYRMYKK